MGRRNGAGVRIDPNVLAQWAANVKALRGTTKQEDFAEQLGIDQGTLSRLERTGRCSDDLKWLICGKANVTVQAVFPWPFSVPALHIPEPEPKPRRKRAA